MMTDACKMNDRDLLANFRHLQSTLMMDNIPLALAAAGRIESLSRPLASDQ